MSDVIQSILSSTPPIPSSLRTHLHDAHCHPTETSQTLTEIDPMSSGSLCAMASRLSDQSLVSSFHEDNPEIVIPFFGYHPWFAHLIAIDGDDHYGSILKPRPTDTFRPHLPEPVAWSDALQELRRRLESNPRAQVGEIGLDKAFRLPNHINGERDTSSPDGLSPYKTKVDHQLRIFIDQCKLAGEFGRAVSVHSVQCHGLVFTTLQSLWKGHEINKKKLSQKSDGPGAVKQFPPRVCIHSASLPIETLKEYLNPSVPAKVFLSFSTAINARYGQKLLDLISAVPDDRILIESDWHSEGSTRRSQLEDITRVVLYTKKWSAEEGVLRLEQNFNHFVYGDECDHPEKKLSPMDRDIYYHSSDWESDEDGKPSGEEHLH
jgi:Tat protein secretion system quality control protein TatD with DNase activity